jgi:hypothetical protein
MTLKTTRFLSLLLVALTFGMAFCHVMEIPGKLHLNGAQWLTVQQNLYIAFGVVGAAICMTAGLIVRALLVAPMNAALSGWTPETLPADWTNYRDQWETGQAIHAALFGLGFSALAIALLGEISNKAIR